MKPPLHPSLQTAHRVLSKLNLSKAIASRCDVFGYDNGREHGLMLRVCIAAVGLAFRYLAWSEARGTDEIVVYVETAGAGSGGLPEGSPSARAYHNARFFQRGKHEHAARYIERQVLAMLETKPKKRGAKR